MTAAEVTQEQATAADKERLRWQESLNGMCIVDQRVARIELAKKRKSERQVIQKEMRPTEAMAARTDIAEYEKQ